MPSQTVTHNSVELGLHGPKHETVAATTASRVIVRKEQPKCRHALAARQAQPTRPPIEIPRRLGAD